MLRRLLSAALLIALAIASILPSYAAATGTPTPEPAKTIEDQQRFRAEFGLRDDRAYVEGLARAPSPQWGVPLSDGEEADLAQRVRIQDSLGSLKDFLATLPSFGGLYIDQKAGGAIDIAFTAGEPSAALRAQVAMLAPREATFRYRSVRYSLAELKSVQRELEAMMVEGTPTGRTIKSVSTNVTANVVEVGVASENRSTAGAFIQATYGDRVSIVDPVIVTAAACISRYDCTPYRAGLYISRVGAACTGGFIAKNSQPKYFWLTAGHCGGIGTTWYHNAGAVGNITLNSYFNGSTADAAAIALTVVPPNYLYVTDGEQARTVTSRQGYNADATGESVCQSGVTTGFWCGTITNTDFSAQPAPGITLLHMRRATYKTQAGDSGGPVFYGSMAKGVVHGYVTGNMFDSVYSHVWEVEQQLGLTVKTN